MENRYYFDHAGTSPLDEEVLEAMKPYFLEKYGNPSSIYQEGQEADRAVEKARQQVQNLINAEKSEEIIFTGSGTEADNLAVKGAAIARENRGKHIITSEIEHHAVLHTCEYLEENRDYEVTYLSVDEDGLIDLEELKEEIREDTTLISIMMANNEIGTIQPVKEIAEIADKRDIIFHTDAVQAAGQLELDVQELGVDLLSLSAHKINGPKGVGALYRSKGTKLVPQMNGGAQENKLRASTENVPNIVGFGKAAELALKRLPEKQEKLQNLRDKIIDRVREDIDDVILNGPEPGSGCRLPNNVNFCFRYIEGESILLNLDMEGIAASSGSACTSGSLEPSHVLLALGLSHEVAHGSLRLTLGYSNTEEEVDYLLEVLPEVIERLREMSPLYD
ncbi:cysteine desulfurase NifS [Halarsenatibacter silvermanii]|uniref:Cysteine desulfurase IscS n=1 Tax=Halarsenatibacter silvermanii TaxID=321763 RepID=A0A1G9JQ01_9FIRM|nr:cysteine desulfurase NifS [Halarsenatibacter silvermanii]SDL39531.1 cysteine desulfurase [Halarsenatibacter silvermanii]